MTDLVVTAPDGVDLSVRDHEGEGPDIVFLHIATMIQALVAP